jgi:hypothetical protein
MVAMENSNNSLAFTINANYFEMLKESMVKANKKINPELLNLTKNIKGDDNPILMICELK